MTLRLGIIYSEKDVHVNSEDASVVKKLQGLLKKLNTAIEKWSASWYEHLPFQALEVAIPPTGFGKIHTSHCMRLPSDYTATQWADFHLQELAEHELRLRIGHAFDVLHRLRSQLGLKSFLVRDKHANARGTAMHTRSEERISKSARKVQKWAHIYRYNWDRLQVLLSRGVSAACTCFLGIDLSHCRS